MLIAGPSLAYFIFKNAFNTKLIKIPVLLFSLYFIFTYLLRGSLEVAFIQMSVNYVSVVMIMNIALVSFIEKRQGVSVSIWPALVGFFLALLAQGRAGILVTLFLVLNVLFMHWRGLKSSIKLISAVIFISGLVIFILSQIDTILLVIENIEFLERFSKKGVDSPSRDILKREYFSHMNTENIILGYNYQNNHWFKHYGGNPHNSYIRLHHYFGFFFFLIVPLIIIALVRLLFRNVFICGLFFAVLLRAYTDTVLFLTLYDFMVILLFYYSFNYMKIEKEKKLYPSKVDAN